MYWIYNLTGSLIQDGDTQSAAPVFEANWHLDNQAQLGIGSITMINVRNLATAVMASAPLVAGLYINGSVIAPCDSPIYCHGEILKQIELARPFPDSKTFVDMPAKKSLEEIEAAFEKLEKPLSNNTALYDFLDEYFSPAGGELSEVSQETLDTQPLFLDVINDTVIREFTEKVIDIWPDLTRTYSGGSTSGCEDCPNSFLPVDRTFVVAGGRFREPYYWDSFWIIEGLLRTGGAFTEISKNIIENFLDFVEDFGFVPNGARLYYLNRSQPPLLSQMVKIYVEYTNDTSILERAVPLLEKEYEFWMKNRTVDIEVGEKTYTLNQYNVQNTQPRPESFREDYITATNSSYTAADGTVYPEVEKLSDAEVALVYKNLATGAESGWDYTSRWMARPADAATDRYFPLRYLDIVDIVPVDLNSILYSNEMAMAEFLDLQGDKAESTKWTDKAEARSEAMYAVMWNETLQSYFDYNLTSHVQNTFLPADEDAEDFEKDPAPEGMMIAFNIAQLYPFWTGAVPDVLKAPEKTLAVYDRVARYLDIRKGGIPATNFPTGQQWDQPNVWPPLQYIIMNGLLNVAKGTKDGEKNGKGVYNLALKVGQRYLDSTFCTWYATGGSTSETRKLESVPDEDNGVMFEKYADNSTNRVGSGGEYEVVEGFGWTNGVLIWTVDTFRNELKRPVCEDLES